MLARIDPTVLPALRIAGIFFLIINLVGGTYIFRNRRRLFASDPAVYEDVPAVRSLRSLVIAIPWFILSGRLGILLIGFWLA